MTGCDNDENHHLQTVLWGTEIKSETCVGQFYTETATALSSGHPGHTRYAKGCSAGVISGGDAERRSKKSSLKRERFPERCPQCTECRT